MRHDRIFKDDPLQGSCYPPSMSAALQLPMTQDDFLQWEERQPARYEFDGFQPVAMTGGSVNHAVIQANLVRHLGNRLDSGPCRVFGSDLKIAVADAIRYPDAFVVCGPLRGKDNIVPNPVVVFEILSPSTQGTDLIRKNANTAQPPPSSATSSSSRTSRPPPSSPAATTSGWPTSSPATPSSPCPKSASISRWPTATVASNSHRRNRMRPDPRPPPTGEPGPC
jgi:Putative restriction endonuclease